MEFIGVLLTAIILMSFYFIPTMSAISRRHVNTLPIFLTNLYLGWTVIGWIAAMIWSVSVMAEPGATPAARNKKLHYFLYIIGALLVMAVIVAFLAPPSQVSDGTKAPRQNISGKVPAPAMREGVPVPADEIFGK